MRDRESELRLYIDMETAERTCNDHDIVLDIVRVRLGLQILCTLDAVQRNVRSYIALRVRAGCHLGTQGMHRSLDTQYMNPNQRVHRSLVAWKLERVNIGADISDVFPSIMPTRRVPGGVCEGLRRKPSDMTRGHLGSITIRISTACDEALQELCQRA